MKCPQCGQWNRASLPHCQRCGAPLEQESAPMPEWRATLRDDGAGKRYIHVDEEGEAVQTYDGRDALAREMA